MVTRLPWHSIVGRQPPRRGDRPSRRGTHPSGHLPGAFVDEEATTRRTFTPSRSFIGSRSTLSQPPLLAIVNSRRSTPLSALPSTRKGEGFW
ncbi:hypothetical protein ACP70R_048875 [Stipagrostis hirtigluma subsp. patula]